MVETLTSKTKAWEKEQGVPFLYDGVSSLSKPIKLMARWRSSFQNLIWSLSKLSQIGFDIFHCP